MIVMKFGGTSVEDAAAIERVAQIVRRRKKDAPVVVVSALAKITDQLVQVGQQAASGDCESCFQILAAIRERHLETARALLSSQLSLKIADRIESVAAELEHFVRGVAAVHELSPRSSDCLLSFGELLSSEIVTAALTDRGLDSVWVDSRECIVTDSTHTRARPAFDATKSALQAKVAPIVDKSRIPVMGGFIAATEEGIPTTLGRGGSDFSAAIVGAALDAERIEIWTDVEGMMTTDPRLAPDARTIPQISFNEAAELAYFGAKVLHPATLLPAIEQNIPVYVLNSRNLKSKGTRITAHAPRGEHIFRAITAKSGISMVNVVASRGLMVHNFLRSVFEALDRHGCPVDLVAISEVSLSFTMESKRLPETLLGELAEIADVTCEDQQAIVCLVGEDIHGKPGIAANVFTTVAKAGVNVRMISQGASEINISFVIKESDVPQAVRHLHAHFFSSHSAAADSPSGSAGRRRTRKAAGRSVSASSANGTKRKIGSGLSQADAAIRTPGKQSRAPQAAVPARAAKFASGSRG
ncbi:MAG TPA: lysine-sensitive aspartokinase 3 [Terriglobales bacterium]|nr:lysine-sensitive aspartokinase 3 [Terriglobales bacterium]